MERKRIPIFVAALEAASSADGSTSTLKPQAIHDMERVPSIRPYRRGLVPPFTKKRQYAENTVVKRATNPIDLEVGAKKEKHTEPHPNPIVRLRFTTEQKRRAARGEDPLI